MDVSYKQLLTVLSVLFFGVLLTPAFAADDQENHEGAEHSEGSHGDLCHHDENEAYDPAHDAWQAMAPMPTGRHGLGSAVVDGRIYVISGGPTPGGSFSDLNEVFTPPDTGTSKPSEP